MCKQMSENSFILPFKEENNAGCPLHCVDFQSIFISNCLAFLQSALFVSLGPAKIIKGREN